MTWHSNSVLVRKTCPPTPTVMSISIKQDFICARSVGPFGSPEEEKGAQHMFFLFLEICSSRAAWNLFDVGNKSVPTHLASTIPFGWFQCPLEGGKDTPSGSFAVAQVSIFAVVHIGDKGCGVSLLCERRLSSVAGYPF